MRRFEIIDRDAFIRDIPNGNYDDVVFYLKGVLLVVLVMTFIVLFLLL